MDRVIGAQAHLVQFILLEDLSHFVVLSLISLQEQFGASSLHKMSLSKS